MTDTPSATVCNLPEPDLQNRKAVIRRKLTPFLTQSTYASGTSQLAFAKPDVTRQTLEHLMELERDCCSFLNFELTETTTYFQLSITGPEGSQDRIRNFFAIPCGSGCGCTGSGQPTGSKTKTYIAGFITMCAVACSVPPVLAALGLIGVGMGAYMSRGVEAVVILAIMIGGGFLAVRYLQKIKRKES